MTSNSSRLLSSLCINYLNIGRVLMISMHMHIPRIFRVKLSSTVLTCVDKTAWEVETLHVVQHVNPLAVGLATERAAVGRLPRHRVRSSLLDVLV